MEYRIEMGIGRKRKSGENYVKLCEMEIQRRVLLHSEICNNEGISYGQ